MENENEVIIIGGGLAGLIAAIHLSKRYFYVTVIEKNEFPKHKVCGEYISNEVLPYFEWLDIKIADLKPTDITKLKFSTINGKSITSDLPMGGFGISRYELDFYLYKKAIENGCKIIKDEVQNIVFDNNLFEVATTNGLNLKSKIVLGAFGKRSNLDLLLNRDFIQKKSPWLAVKAHYSGEFNADFVGLHNFNGGYCGVSKVENEIINICYLVRYNSFKKYKNITDFQEMVLKKNPHLKQVLENSKLLFEKPLTISQISFEKKLPVENHILMIGDTAGLIHPLCGNGMAMAIHSAKIASDLVEKYLSNKIKSRLELEKKYTKKWNFNFKSRLKMGRVLAKLLLQPKLSNVLLRILIIFPFVLKFIIKKTHGKTIPVNYK
ncbi:NAD(P)/FAD-dependent oxidoreductase [Flavobacterium aquatile]|uniref:FAD-dependent oxidoreductase n=1 Tax=Flavobacterium aquatile LMG 4008 = ATCC 11947 TaxID=1453498 RepID=A0A095ST13_9FLAO|nr:NAD(P)/FAD-dependent oxidoreductase [Flavobacterium aquatile]KGD67786.1 FAD-dependent oxidoreductase [Flavobacterium aquatile LMG 4008 = ATCC 11947]OXA67644.1 FAD-dependent oxidoreductase [Flavobacterium aquatile LMG 4008 = ATCC 11947]GEC78282.1 FAD-dependent oxidoreductase [Flavobacterium aquatile]